MKILGILYKLFSSKTNGEYEERYKELLGLKPPKKFMEYYNEQWNKNNFFEHWTCINRESTFGDWATNNSTEAMFRKLQTCVGKNFNRLDEFLIYMIKFLRTEPYSIQLDRYPTETEKEAQKRFNESKEISVERMRREKYLYRAQSQTNKTLQWTCDLYTMSCDCLDFYRNCRPCKHLYACMRQYVETYKIFLPDEDEDIECFHYINAVYLHIHEPENFQYWNAQVLKAYPQTFEKPGRPSKVKKTKGKGKTRKQPEIQYEIESVEGVRVLSAESPEIFVKWKGYDKLSWALFDKYTNFEFTMQFFDDLSRFSKMTKGRGKKEFDCIQRSSESRDPYSFFLSSKKVSSFPFHSAIVDFAKKFEIILK
jgi:hypothetical protein